MKSNNQQYCTNCGKTNHVYKECTYPIISYGILAFKISNNNIETLMVQRKDSLTFVEFMRGKYDIDDNKKLINLITNMSNYEKQNILQKPFDDLWKELWGEHLVTKNTINMNNMKRFQREYFVSKKKFTVYESEIRKLINTIPKKYYDTEWGIAKGRRNLYENDINCAKREFLEETDLCEKDITLLNCNPIKVFFCDL